MTRILVEYVPLTQWPAGRARTPDSDREAAKFKAPSSIENNGQPNQRYVGPKPIALSQTLEDLDRELWQIGCSRVVVQIDIANKEEFRRDLRADGVISSKARVKSPAVVVSFLRNKVPTQFATDHFLRWEDNLRAIVLGMEALRKLERYHIVRAGDQYRGWQALPATTTTALSTEQAAEVLARRSDRAASAKDILGVRALATLAYRAAAAKTHPDAGGLADDFKLVQEAKRVLEAHHGGPL